MRFARWLLLGGFVVFGCGSDKGGSGGGAPGTGGDSNQDGGAAGSGSGAVSGGGSGGNDAAPDSMDPTYDGIDLSTIGATAPASCTGGLDNGTLTISLDAGAPRMVLAVVGGEIQANGTTCTSSGGDHATPSNVSSIVVTGGGADEKVYIDLSNGSFGAALAGMALDLGGGDDQLIVIGTTGDDHFDAGQDGEQVVVDLDGDGQPELHASHIEALLMTSGAGLDRLSADGSRVSVGPVAVPVSLYGGSGDDLLRGGAAADSLFGGDGQDGFDMGKAPAGADVLDGGPGVDAADFSGRTAIVRVTLAGGADDGEDGEGVDVRASVEIVVGGSADDVLTGNAQANQLNGGPGNDTLSGGAGDDFLFGGAGNDTINGDAGNDYIYGEDGDDILHGGDDDDLVDGNTGKNVVDGGASDGDICVYTAADTVSACEL